MAKFQLNGAKAMIQVDYAQVWLMDETKIPERAIEMVENRPAPVKKQASTVRLSLILFKGQYIALWL